MRALALLAAALLLGACAAPRLPGSELAPGASMAEVEAAMGKPKETLVDSAGRTVWFYPYPRGIDIRESYAAVFGADGRLQRLEQRLTSENIAKIQKGWTKQQVRDVFGSPWKAYQLQRLPYEEWDYRVTTDLDNDLLIRFTPEGVVHQVSLLHDPKYDRGP